MVLLSVFTFTGIRGAKNGLRDWLIMLACTSVVLFPWGIRNYTEMGTSTFLPSNSGYNLWVASRPADAAWWSDSEEFTRATNDWENYYIDQTADANFKETALENIGRDSFFTIIGRAAYRWFTGMVRFPGTGSFAGMNLKFIAFTAVQSGMIILAAVALFMLKSRKAWFVFLLPLLALSSALPVSKGLTRYLLPALPAIAMLAGHSVIELSDLIKKKLNNRYIKDVEHK